MMILLEHTVYSKLHDNQQYLIDLHSFNNQKKLHLCLCFMHIPNVTSTRRDINE